MTDEVLSTCPKCSAVLERRSVVGIEIDRCVECGGLWLDKGELAHLRLSEDMLSLEELQGGASTVRSVPPSSKRVRLPCPVCEGRLGAVQVDEQTAVDVCDRCNGLWLDRGELQATLRAIASNADPAVVEALLRS